MAETATSIRGDYLFAIDAAGTIQNTAANVELLRRLWLDRAWIKGDSIGPGDPGDFDFGAWHVACHLLGAAGVRQMPDERLLWLEVSWSPLRDEYIATLTLKQPGGARTVPLDSAESRDLLVNSTLIGFVEGNSTGRTSARAVCDSPTLFNLWRRQDFDQPITSEADGGKVWEHWCTLRDIRTSSRIGTSVLTAYVGLVAALGDQFPAAVARGRRDYGHPTQLCAMVQSGFIGDKAATSNMMPEAIPPRLEHHFLEAQCEQALEGCTALDWSKTPKYFMFRRRIDQWSPVSAVRKDLSTFRKHLPQQ